MDCASDVCRVDAAISLCLLTAVHCADGVAWPKRGFGPGLKVWLAREGAVKRVQSVYGLRDQFMFYHELLSSLFAVALVGWSQGLRCCD